MTNRNHNFSLPLNELYVCDIEGDNLNVAHDTNERVYLVGLRNIGTGHVMIENSIAEFTDLYLQLRTPYLVFHNASFDVSALRLRGVPIEEGNYYCTMVGSHTLYPESSDFHSLAELQPQTKHKLKDLLVEAGVHIPSGYKKGDEYTWYGKGDYTVDSIVEEYLLKDLEATATEYLRQVEEYKLLPAKTNELLWTTNIPYIERIMSMEQGVKITYDESIANVLSETSVSAYNACLTTVGYQCNPEPFRAGLSPYPKAGFKAQGDFCKMEPFNPNSNAQVVSALKRLYQWEPTKLTKGGDACVSSEVLESLDYPLAEHLLNYSKSTKLLTFCDNIKGLDWVYPSYNQCATRTTRLSCSGVNIQQVPARDKVGKQLRKMFTARDGYTLLVGDQSGFQLRIVAAYMSYYFDDHRLTQCFNNGEDVHQFFADIYGVPRKLSKSVSFGWLFGAGVAKMTATANRGNPNPISSDVIKGALRALEERMPAMPGVKELFIEHARENKGIVYDWLGTRYVIPELTNKDKGIRASGERKVCNYLIQGLEASLFRHLQNKAAAIVETYGGRQAFCVHDEVGYEVPLDVAELLVPLINDVMSPAFSDFTPEPCTLEGLRLDCEFGIGNNWLDAKGE